MVAASSGHEAAVHVLLAAGADVNQADTNWHDTALHKAALKGHAGQCGSAHPTPIALGGHDIAARRVGVAETPSPLWGGCEAVCMRGNSYAK